MTRIIDISQPVGPGIAVWPGDQEFKIDWTLRQDRGDSVNVAALTLSVHTGTHTDGGFHVMPEGIRPDEMDLFAYLGACTVVDAYDGIDESLLDRIGVAKRILFRTRSQVDEKQFPPHFHAPTPGLAKQLVAAGVRLIGSDAPSMDDVDSKTLDSHRILALGKVATLENLVLTDVQPGNYTLVALPLKLREADSSPVRAILIEGSIEDL